MPNALTYSITHTPADPWVGTDTYVRTPCQCGVSSGIPHTTLTGAVTEVGHICRTSHQRPVWDGVVLASHVPTERAAR